MEAIYDAIGAGYNTTRQADPYLTNRLFELLAPAPGECYLDIGCGTGNYTCALAGLGLDLTGVEPSEKMLTEARRRKQFIKWLKGSAESIPVSDGIYAGVIATLTIHHWTDLNAAIRELYRVTKDKAKMVIFTAAPDQMEGYWLNKYFPKMLRASIMQMPSFQQIKDALFNGGFKIAATEKYFIQDALKDLFLYSGKNKPELYFNDAVRNGISSFAALANADEVNAGIIALRDDLDSGNFEVVKKEYENDKGDYLFIVAEKV